MSIFSKLTEKPWLAQPERQDAALLYLPDEVWPERTALKFLLAIISVLFSLFIVTMLGRSQLPDFQVLAGEPWLPLTDRTSLWLNSAILLGGSLCMHCAQRFSRSQQVNGVLLALTAAVWLYRHGGQQLLLSINRLTRSSSARRCYCSAACILASGEKRSGNLTKNPDFVLLVLALSVAVVAAIVLVAIQPGAYH